LGARDAACAQRRTDFSVVSVDLANKQDGRNKEGVYAANVRTRKKEKKNKNKKKGGKKV
jgi:hypothetical protein